jgi:glycosyltransferase involved in cell wall biosynthesis
MKNIKVYLQYPWKVSDSQYYKSLIEFPPENIKYQNIRKKEGMIINKKKLSIVNFLKRSIRNFLEEIQMPILNIHKSPCQKDYEIIHCAHCLSKNKNKPWIADFESPWQMFISGRDTKKGNKKALKILMRNNCKKILAWTEKAEKEIISKFPEVKDKVEIVSFAIPVPKIKKNEHKGINLLFVSRYFHEKGGEHTLEAFRELTKKYKNVKCIFISQTPKKIIKKYSSNNKINFFDLIPHGKLIEEIFPKMDILVYPAYSDTFGFIFVEAMSFGLPIITVDGFARKDIINEGKTGFIIEREKNNEWYPKEEEGKKIIEKLIEKTSLLIENKKLRKKMSNNCIKVIKEGKFSIKERNKRLKKIYSEVLK